MAGDDEDSTNTRRRRLGTKLRTLREIDGASGRELAKRIGFSQSKLSRIEAGAALPSKAELTAWAKAVGATDQLPALRDLLANIKHAEVEDWYSGISAQQSLPDTQREAKTAIRRTRSVQPTMVPVLLQTPDYAQRVLTMFKQIMPRINVPMAAAKHINRQSSLYEEDKKFEFLISEAALRWRPGPPRLLLAQLGHLMVMNTKDNINIGLIPLLAIESTAPLPPPFTIYDTQDDSFVQADTVHEGMTIHTPETVAIYEHHWAAQRQMAKFNDDAHAILEQVIAEVGTLAD